jgi:dTDP-4-dehydrorhamnose reductase
MKVLIVGATGMLGHTLMLQLSMVPKYETHGTLRRRKCSQSLFPERIQSRLHENVEVGNFNSVLRLLDNLRPDVVINCIGVIKQLAEAKDPVQCITVNALFPHRLAAACGEIGARLIHISTDCVFSGGKGGYVESDFPDCDDLYGRTKLLGEVDCPHAVTLRTSIIGHELSSRVSLIDWFLSQQGCVQGFTRAIYSGFSTVEMAHIISDFVIPKAGLHGLYHVSSEPISKYEILCLVRGTYGKQIDIVPYDGFVCDRSLDSTRFRQATGYFPPSWPQLVKAMHSDWVSSNPHQASRQV